MLIETEVLGNEGVDILVLDGVEIRHNLAEGHVVHMVSETHLGLDLVSVGHRYIVHLVAEADDAAVLGVGPCSGNPLPHGDVLERLLVLPVSYHGLVALAHAREDMAELAVTVGALVEVHEVHVHGVPGNLLVELGMEMQQGLAQALHSVYPHLRGREGVHPGDDAYAPGLGLGPRHYVHDFGRRVGGALVYEFHGKEAGFVHSVHHLLRMSVYLHDGVASVEELRAGDEPHFEIFKCFFHNSNQL